jgi:hypothetical protein
MQSGTDYAVLSKRARQNSQRLKEAGWCLLANCRASDRRSALSVLRQVTGMVKRSPTRLSYWSRKVGGPCILDETWISPAARDLVQMSMMVARTQGLSSIDALRLLVNGATGVEQGGVTTAGTLQRKV